jgi:hypothetical protein
MTEDSSSWKLYFYILFLAGAGLGLIFSSQLLKNVEFLGIDAGIFMKDVGLALGPLAVIAFVYELIGRRNLLDTIAQSTMRIFERREIREENKKKYGWFEFQTREEMERGYYGFYRILGRVTEIDRQASPKEILVVGTSFSFIKRERIGEISEALSRGLVLKVLIGLPPIHVVSPEVGRQRRNATLQLFEDVAQDAQRQGAKGFLEVRTTENAIENSFLSFVDVDGLRVSVLECKLDPGRTEWSQIFRHDLDDDCYAKSVLEMNKGRFDRGRRELVFRHSGDESIILECLVPWGDKICMFRSESNETRKERKEGALIIPNATLIQSFARSFFSSFFGARIDKGWLIPMSEDHLVFVGVTQAPASDLSKLESSREGIRVDTFNDVQEALRELGLFGFPDVPLEVIGWLTRPGPDGPRGRTVT